MACGRMESMWLQWPSTNRLRHMWGKAYDACHPAETIEDGAGLPCCGFVRRAGREELCNRNTGPYAQALPFLRGRISVQPIQ